MSRNVVFTADLDWASEEIIEDTLKLFDGFGVPLTVFTTHHSQVLRDYYNDHPKHVGVHPNFSSDSSQGVNAFQVVDYLHNVWPEAVCYRSHRYVDSLYIQNLFLDRGFKYDANLCVNLSPVSPFRRLSGLMCFPTCFEDIHYAFNGGLWNLEDIKKFLDGDGVKIFNFHPVYIYLNAPSYLYYRRMVDSGEMKVYDGLGVRTFLGELLDYIDHPIYLDDLYSRINGDEPDVSSWIDEPEFNRNIQHLSKWGNITRNVYDRMSDGEKSNAVKNVYDSLTDKSFESSTLDQNLRELETRFIVDGLDGRRNILELGCGNGYTCYQISARYGCNVTGVDFSKTMIDNAVYQQKFLNLENPPTFIHCDATTNLFEKDHYDAVVTQRFLLNLPSRGIQYTMIRKIYNMLADGGVFMMVEGTLDGLERLNDLRIDVGLEPIPDRGPNNISSLKFCEDDLERFLLKPRFAIVKKTYFGTYYLISRVVHPLLVYPEDPRYESSINKIAQKVAMICPDVADIGHLVGYKLIKK